MTTKKRYLKVFSYTFAVLFGAFITFIFNISEEKITSYFGNKLVYTAINYTTTMNTRYLPVLNWTFAPKPVYILFLIISNNGRHTQHDVHVLVEGMNEAAMSCSKEAILHSRNGEPMNVYNPIDFKGKSVIDFVVSRIPPQASYSFIILSVQKQPNELPRITIQSESRIATWVEPKPIFKAFISVLSEDMLKGKLGKKYRATPFVESPLK